MGLQTPHLDFISIRPVASPMLHVIDLLISKDHVFLVSRGLVWMQVAVVTWLWSKAAFQYVPSIGEAERLLVSLIAFHCSLSVFLISPWHTMDGLFFASIGVHFLLRCPRSPSWIGFGILGVSILCKQSFLFAPILMVLTLKEYRNWSNMVSMIVPVALYALAVAVAGGFSDLMLQISSHIDVAEIALKPILNRECAVGLAFSTLPAVAWRFKHRLGSITPALVRFLIFSIMPSAVYIYCLVAEKYLFIYSNFLFGLLCGAIIFMLISRFVSTSSLWTLSTASAFLAWSSSLSIGSNWPILASGMMLLCLYAYGMENQPDRAHGVDVRSSHIRVLCMGVLSVIGLGAYVALRKKVVYQDLSEPYLVMHLDGILPGGNGIRTNKETAAFLSELRDLARESTMQGRTYAVVPDCAGWWVASDQPNLLPIDWPQDTELHRQELLARVILSMDELRSSNDVLVQKGRARSLVTDLAPKQTPRIVDYVRSKYTKIHEGQFFEVYR
ncbi:MAG: hypothetical protein K8H99_01505 [Nitrospirae bacterium]|nr:hypothetical protein [Fimbriimonadaceae bacterium]